MLDSLNKALDEELGREFGIELDRRKKKATLVEEIKSVISSK